MYEKGIDDKSMRFEAIYVGEYHYHDFENPSCIKTGLWFGTFLIFQYIEIENFIIPTDELIFFRGVGQPPTRKLFCFL